MRAMISSSSSSLLQFPLLCDLKMSFLLDFIFSAAAVTSCLPLSSATAASSHFSACALFAAPTFLLSAVAFVSFSPSTGSLIAAGSSLVC